MSEIDKAASKHLGQSGSYAVETDKFDPSLLVKMPRAEARDMWGVDPSRFVGVDVWRAYESTFLLENGFPVAGTLKIVCPADSEFMVESKSLKLYLNTFDMCKMGRSIGSGIMAYENQVAEDLSNLLEADIKVGFFTEVREHDRSSVFDEFILIDELVEHDPADSFSDYFSKEDHIRFAQKSYAELHVGKERGDLLGHQQLYTNLLRSRCRHTKQKDSGSAYLFIRSKTPITHMSFLKQIVSMREINEFHEFCAEKIFSNIQKASNAKELNAEIMIACLYARRGGIDINPIRATSWDLVHQSLMNEGILCDKTMMQ